MGIIFDKLPMSKPKQDQKEQTLLPKGRYTFIVKKASVLMSAAGTEYLRVILECTNPEHKGVTVYDNISMSEKQLAQYKLMRFITGTGLADSLRNQTFELEDIAKVVPDTVLDADITIEEAKNNYPEKNIVDCFAGEIYYPKNEVGKDSFQEKINGLFDENNL